MATASRPSTSYAEYVAMEAAAATKHEYLRGEVFAMAGGSPEHGRLQANLARMVGNGLVGKPCVVLSSDVRVRIDASDRTTYPDLSVVCGPRAASPVDPYAITNPVVLVEILSESTERDDRGPKFAHYRKLPALEEYLLVAQDTRRLELFRRSDVGWVLTEAGAGEALTLASIDVVLDVDALYFDPTA